MRLPLIGRVAVIVVCLAAAAVLVLRAMRPDDDVRDFPEGTLWVCSAADCGAGFALSLDELAAFYAEHPDEEVPCPECSAPGAQRAVRCAACQRHYPTPPRGTRDPKCPHCGAAQPPPGR